MTEHYNLALSGFFMMCTGIFDLRRTRRDTLGIKIRPNNPFLRGLILFRKQFSAAVAKCVMVHVQKFGGPAFVALGDFKGLFNIVSFQ